MIHMLSRFDLKASADLDEFTAAYARLVANMRALDLAESTGPVGQRLDQTDMDTDAADAPRYYAVMNFRDRAQLDAAYTFLLTQPDDPSHKADHGCVKRSVARPVFTCWEDLS